MLIDAILDRKYERENRIFRYDPRELYKYINGWAGGLYDPVARAMDEGTEADVKKALCFYIGSQGYNKRIKDFVNSVDWLVADKKPTAITPKIHQELRCYKNEAAFHNLDALDIKTAVNENEDNAENYRTHFAIGVAWGLTIKYQAPVVAVLETGADGVTKVTKVHHVFRYK
jgi:hypothetical protein